MTSRIDDQMPKRNGRDRRERVKLVAHDQSPPNNIDAEMALLGIMMVDPESAHEPIQLTAPGEFFRESHQYVAEAIWHLYREGLPYGGIEVAEYLRTKGTFADVGGDIGLIELAEKVEASARAPYLAHIVHSKFTARKLIEVGNAMRYRGYAEASTVEEQVAQAEQAIYDISAGRTACSLGPIGAGVGESMKRIEERKGQYAGIHSGLRALDGITDGWQDGQLIVLGARPSMGKTALVGGALLHAASRGVTGLLVSLEMTRVEVGERTLMHLSGVAGEKLKHPRLLDMEDTRRIAQAERDALDLPIFVDDSPSHSPLSILAAARRIQGKHGLGLVVVDYLQLVDGDNRSDRREQTRQEQIAAMSRKFKMMARDLGVPVLLVSQLNRQLEGREDRRPRMSDLRESGAIEQDADVVLLLHRPEYYNPDDQRGIAEVIVSKNRNGATGTAKLAWRQEVCSFADLALHAEPIDGSDF